MKKAYQSPSWKFVPLQKTDILTESGDNFEKEETLFGVFD